MISLIYSSFFLSAPGNFCARKDSSYLKTLPILDDYVIRMLPSDLIGCDNRGTKGVILVHLFHITVSD